MNLKFTLILLLFTTSGTFSLKAQNESELKYNLKFIKAVKIDKDGNSVMVIFEVTPKHQIDFPPVIGGKYTLDVNKRGKPEVIIMSKQNERKLNILIFGKNEPEKPSKIHQLIKTLVDFDNYDEVLFFVLKFYNIADKPIDEMSLKFGFWEKHNQDKRIEQMFEFEVE